MRFFLQSRVNVHERLAAMRGDYDDGSRTWEFIVAAGVLLVILGGLAWVYRFYLQRLARKARVRLSDFDDAKKNRSVKDIDAEVATKLGAIANGSEVWLFWTAGDRRRRSAARAQGFEEGMLRVMPNDGGLSRPEGAVRVVAPFNGTRGLQFETELAENSGGIFYLRPVSGEPPIEVKDRRRIAVGLKGAAAPTGEGAEEVEAFPVRIIDVSQDGIGVLSDRPIATGGRYRLKVVLGDREEMLTVDTRASWVDEGVAGIHRGGMQIETRSFPIDALLSDYIRQEAGRPMIGAEPQPRPTAAAVG
ncbi:MAG: hypothetical protein R3F20_07270 [Planctomycetota bacterium]